MQGYPGMPGMPMNRPGLGLRPPMPSFGQGPSMMTLAQGRQPPPPVRPMEGTTVFVGSIAGGITDAFLNQLLSVRLPFLIFENQLNLLTLVQLLMLCRHVARCNRSSA